MDKAPKTTAPSKKPVTPVTPVTPKGTLPPPVSAPAPATGIFGITVNGQPLTFGLILKIVFFVSLALFALRLLMGGILYLFFLAFVHFGQPAAVAGAQ